VQRRPQQDIEMDASWHRGGPLGPRLSSLPQRRPESGNPSRCKSTLYLAPLIEQNGQQCEVDDLQPRLRWSLCGYDGADVQPMRR
jgi:hypothetical protein